RRCGEGVVDTVDEVCDDGVNNNAACVYGTATCARCNATCSGFVIKTGPTCGDGVMTNGETCDDGPLNNAPCDYGTATCMRCNATCEGMVMKTGNVCGDGVRDVQHEA